MTAPMPVRVEARLDPETLTGRVHLGITTPLVPPGVEMSAAHARSLGSAMVAAANDAERAARRARADRSEKKSARKIFGRAREFLIGAPTP